jgi:hypothetical protein
MYCCQSSTGASKTPVPPCGAYHALDAIAWQCHILTALREHLPSLDRHSSVPPPPRAFVSVGNSNCGNASAGGAWARGDEARRGLSQLTFSIRSTPMDCRYSRAAQARSTAVAASAAVVATVSTDRCENGGGNDMQLLAQFAAAHQQAGPGPVGRKRRRESHP